ncbi:MAG: P1 family peptidase, partial [Firmicutes bacterium]|nr:P1 family peptidase [Bacillota bacterium]
MGLEKDCKLNLHGKFEKGPKNLITDVAGVKVAHVTLQSEDHNVNTGVTAILPHSGNLFREKLFAGAAVINGFGKSVGLVQMDELGTLESPILMTNTLSVGTALTAAVKYML